MSISWLTAKSVLVRMLENTFRQISADKIDESIKKNAESYFAKLFLLLHQIIV